MSKPLALAEAEERPEWVPEGVWPELKKDLVLARAGSVKRSVQQIADRWNLPFGKVRSLYASKRWRMDMEEARMDIADMSAVVAYRMGHALADDLDDDEKVKKMTISDKSKVLKMASDNMLNLSNGSVGSPAFQLNFGDVKMLLGTPPKKPE